MSKKSFYLACLLVTLGASTSLYAAEITEPNQIISNSPECNNTLNTFNFVSTNEKINSSGNFEFQISTTVKSDKFKFDSSSATIEISAADVLKYYDGPTVSGYDGHKYTIELKTSLGITKASKTFKVGESDTWDLSGLNPSTTYYLYISNDESLPSGYVIDGSGTIGSFAGTV